MLATAPSTPQGLVDSIESAWAELQAFLEVADQKDSSLQDAKGWTIKDHATHIAVWEDSVTILFRGGRRHEALGIDERLYQEASFDQINEMIKERYSHLQLSEVRQRLNEMHDELMSKVRSLSADQLLTTVRDFFHQAPRTDDRTIRDFIFTNTAGHFAEHLPWMQALLTRAA